MSNLKLIEALCDLVERQSQLIHTLAFKLQEVQALSAENERMVRSIGEEYAALLGVDEFPDIPEDADTGETC